MSTRCFPFPLLVFYSQILQLSISGARTGAALSPTSEWGKDSLEKVTPLSQSSQTDATSKQCSPEATEKSSTPVVCEVCGVKDASVFIEVQLDSSACVIFGSDSWMYGDLWMFVDLLMCDCVLDLWARRFLLRLHSRAGTVSSLRWSRHGLGPCWSTVKAEPGHLEFTSD